MQLVSIWLKDHFLLGTTSINLGGKFIYTFEEENYKLTISRESNKKYISSFYSDECPNLSLVSSIVGKNGSGKTTLLNVIRKVLKGNQGFGGYINP
jgi:signal recognition particle GTPase